MKASNIKYASVSSVSYYGDCSQKWAFKYIYKMPEKTPLAMKIGTANHVVLESVNKWIKEKKTSPDRKYFQDSVDSLAKLSLPLELFTENKRTKAEQKLSEEEFCTKQQKSIASQLKKMCDLYIDKAEENFKEVILVEKDHTMEIAGIPFRMVTDAVVRFNDDSLRVLDYKTKHKSTKDLALLQLVSYGVGVEDLLKEKVNALEQWDFIKKKNPEIRISNVDMHNYESYKRVLEEELKNFWKGINDGFFPRNLKSPYCGPEKCAYWDVCMNPGHLELKEQELADFHSEEVKNLDARRFK